MCGAALEGKCASLPRGALHLYIAALLLRDLPGEVEANANAICLISAGGAVESPKNLGLFPLGNARPGIGHADEGKQRIVFDLHRHRAAGRGAFDGVVQQVAHRLLRPLCVKDGGGFYLPEGQRDVSFRSPGRILRDSPLHHRGEKKT